MKLAIVGSRDYTNFVEFTEKIEQVVGWYFDPCGLGSSEYGDLVIISGGAKGTDSLAEQWAKENNVPCKVIRPDYNVGNTKAAPLLRNTKIAQECEDMIAFWDGESRGTEDVIRKAVKLGKQVTIFSTNTEPV